jgi:hypothetical protein
MMPLDWVLAIVCAPIGCIMAIVYMLQGKPKAGKMLLVSIIAVVIYSMLQFAGAAVLSGGK